MITRDDLKAIMDEELKRLFGDPLPRPSADQSLNTAIISVSSFARRVLDRVPAPMPLLEHEHWEPS